jgi:Cu2+-exporting ATPase
VSAAPSLDLEAIDPERVRVWGAPPGHERTRRLLRWLSRRREVVDTKPRPRTGSIVIRYREPPQQEGSFLRSLRDELFVLSRPPRPSAMRIALDHALPGRMRLRVYNLSDDDLHRLGAWLAQQPGIGRVSTSEATGSILLLYDVQETYAEAILQAARASNPKEWPPPPGAPPRRNELRSTLFNTAVLGVAASGAASPLVTTALVAATAVPPARRALDAIREKRASVDVLDVAAIAISLGMRQHFTAALITWLLGIGDLILDRTSDRARSAISKLTNVQVLDAWLVRGDRVERVRARRLKAGDQIRVYTGEQIPADGVVASGVASVDEKSLTGESMPRTRRPGARVLAASVVVDGQITVDVTRAGGDTTAAKIVRILEGAGAKPMTLQRESQRLADRVVIPTIALALGSSLAAADLARTTSVLITDFGSGIRVAAPTGALSAMTLAAREGILVKGGQYLERLSKVDAIVFDKTGTLTEGSPRIVGAARTGSRDERESMALAAAAEARQSHPLAHAIRRRANDIGARVPEAAPRAESYTVAAGVAAEVGGHRVLVGGERLMRAYRVEVDGRARGAVRAHEEQGASSVFVAIDGRIEFVLAYADVVREGMAAVLEELRAGGRREIVMMSGDGEVTVDVVADRLGIERRMSGMLPEDKARSIKELQREGRVVAMVGDGINDAPALAVADVGISIHGGTDVALEIADVLLVEGGMTKLPRAFAIAELGMKTVRRSLWLVVVPNAAAIVLGALGLIGPGIATVVNNGSTILAALSAAAPLALPRRRARVLA